MIRLYAQSLCQVATLQIIVKSWFPDPLIRLFSGSPKSADTECWPRRGVDRTRPRETYEGPLPGSFQIAQIRYYTEIARYTEIWSINIQFLIND